MYVYIAHAPTKSHHAYQGGREREGGREAERETEKERVPSPPTHIDLAAIAGSFSIIFE
jgi:hypothetical protein